ncbi:MAG: PadR family transcriptional regulator [Gammaproteobacteria bacterium]|nr:PadR family transcriptional regulator [Gammaproteobacteria bacterium]
MAKAKKTKYAILGALSVMPMSGYDIKKWVLNVTGGFWAESPGQIYPILRELDGEGLIDCDTSLGKGARERKLYAITGAGKKVLTKWLREPADIRVHRDELRLKIFYGNNVTPDVCLNHLQERRDSVLQFLVRLKIKAGHIKEEHKNDPNSFYWLLTMRSAIYHSEAELKWCNELIKDITSVQG